MGYSVAIHCSSEKNRVKMMDFMGRHFTRFTDLVKGNVHFPFYQEPKGILTEMDSPPHSNLGYDRKPLALGFNYHAGMDEDNYYRWRILAWMALQVGKMYKYQTIKLPAIIYDGSEKCPLHLNTSDFIHTPDNGKKHNIDQVGWVELDNYLYTSNLAQQNPKTQKWCEERIASLAEMSVLVKVELLRLDTLWKAENLTI